MTTEKTAFIIGASRGLGLALAQEYLKREWRVVATVRGSKPGALSDLAASAKGRLEIETLDVLDAAQLTSLKERLRSRRFDLLFVNAGVANDSRETIGQVSTEEFTRVLLTNTLAPMRVIESFAGSVPSTGTIGVMSSGLGSVADNERGGDEVYRASKAGLNTLMRSFAARHAKDPRTLLIIAPGWIRTEMGGPNATYSIEESIPRIVDVITAQAGKGGLQYLNQQGQPVRW